MNQMISCKTCVMVFVMLILSAYAGSVCGGGQSGNDYDMPEHALSGGGLSSVSSGYILTGTVGQLPRIMSSSDGSVLYGGFWHPKAVEMPWDFSRNGITDFIDLGLLANHWLFTSGDGRWNPKYDLNTDGIVNYLDLGIFGDHWLEEN